MNNKHLIINFPDNFDNNQRGDFFEQFIKCLIEPMRYKVTSRISFTGMEIDLLAEGMDQPKKVIIECKAQKDNLSADIITKLMGNVWLQNADEGWLFSTCDLAKGGRGMCAEIKEDKDKARKFTWYSPEKIIDILITQKSVINPIILKDTVKNYSCGDATLIISPQGKFWLIEILENSIPSKCILFNANNGDLLDKNESIDIKNLDANFSELEILDLNSKVKVHGNNFKDDKAMIARVISGDGWDDLRPAKPTEFVGRDELIQELINFTLPSINS